MQNKRSLNQFLGNAKRGRCYNNVLSHNAKVNQLRSFWKCFFAFCYKTESKYPSNSVLLSGSVWLSTQ